jgi:hypothetical protein
MATIRHAGLRFTRDEVRVQKHALFRHEAFIEKSVVTKGDVRISGDATVAEPGALSALSMVDTIAYVSIPVIYNAPYATPFLCPITGYISRIHGVAWQGATPEIELDVFITDGFKYLNIPHAIPNEAGVPGDATDITINDIFTSANNISVGICNAGSVRYLWYPNVALHGYTYTVNVEITPWNPENIEAARRRRDMQW